LDASYADGYVLNQVYFNTGTWRRVYRPTRSAASDREYMPTECLSYVALFSGDERGGRPFETWSGTLAVDPIDVTVHRVDGGQAVAAAHLPPVATRQPMRAPHFRSAPVVSPASSTARG
jgi:hypothetical protein